jgi:transcription termination/antitermination protein NusG
MKWYAIHTQSGHENKLKFAIETLIKQKGMESDFGEIIVPEIEIEVKKEGKKKLVKKNLYPGYIFIEMNYSEDTWVLLKSVPFQRKPALIGEKRNHSGKKSFVEPKSVSLAEIAKIRKMIEEGEVASVSKIMFEKGEMVLIKEGPFANFKAVIDDVKEGKEKLDVLVNIFGRSTPVELNFSQVEKVED